MDEGGETPWEPKERLGLGVRFGFGMPKGGDESFGAASTIGMFYQRFQVEGSWGLEAGLDLASSASDDTDTDSSLVTASGLLIYCLDKRRTKYVLGGAELW